MSPSPRLSEGDLRGRYGCDSSRLLVAALRARAAVGLNAAAQAVVVTAASALAVGALTIVMAVVARLLAIVIRALLIARVVVSGLGDCLVLDAVGRVRHVVGGTLLVGDV